MNIKGKIRTFENRILDFEFKTNYLGKTLGNSGDWFDNTFCIQSELKINGNPIGTDYYNFCLTDTFKDHMFKNTMVCEINSIEYSEHDKEVIGDNLLEHIEADDDVYNYFKSEFIEGKLNSESLVYEYLYLMDEIIDCEGGYLVDFLEGVFELSNGYHGLSQWNSYLETLFSFINDEYEESKIA